MDSWVTVPLREEQYALISPIHPSLLSKKENIYIKTKIKAKIKIYKIREL